MIENARSRVTTKYCVRIAAAIRQPADMYFHQILPGRSPGAFLHHKIPFPSFLDDSPPLTVQTIVLLTSQYPDKPAPQTSLPPVWGAGLRTFLCIDI